MFALKYEFFKVFRSIGYPPAKAKFFSELCMVGMLPRLCKYIKESKFNTQ